MALFHLGVPVRHASVQPYTIPGPWHGTTWMECSHFWSNTWIYKSKCILWEKFTVAVYCWHILLSLWPVFFWCPQAMPCSHQPPQTPPESLALGAISHHQRGCALKGACQAHLAETTYSITANRWSFCVFALYLSANVNWNVCHTLYYIDVPYITNTRDIGYNLGNEWDASHIYVHRNCPLILNQTWIPIIYNGRLSWQTIFTPLLQHMLPGEFQRKVATSSIQSYWQKKGENSGGKAEST